MVTAIRINSPEHFKVIIIIVRNMLSQVADLWAVQVNEGEEWKKRYTIVKGKKTLSNMSESMTKEAVEQVSNS